ncbi:MAG: 23S rRNA (pseudouridine(1915)-N(3))-methyltransferase RlmH [Chromatiales bacterium]|jgi:23S rRNA (pseudouridine1915-N3)-methyltransferase
MRIHLIAVGTRMPAWVEAGYSEYAKRLPRECRLELVEIAAGRRGKGGNVARALRDEGGRMLAAVPAGAQSITLEVEGRAWSTEGLAERLRVWMGDGRDRALLVGGPEGLSAECRAAAELSWSLSPLTLPHPLVRILIAEQIYRGWSLLAGHPYHRG